MSNTTNTQLAPKQHSDPIERLVGAFTEAKAITARLRWASENCHLISPATTCARLPEGCSVAISVVQFDLTVDAHDVGFGKVSLLKHALSMLASAAGVRWDPRASGRVDDGSDPYYCHWRSIGAWQHLDGTILPIVGDREVDLRDGSAQVERIFATSKDAEKQVREMRAFIVGHAQSKAELRAIRKAFGIRSYTKAELEKPFVTCRLMFTGQSDDPQIRRENAAAIRGTMLGGASALFGSPPGASQLPTMALPAMPVAPMLPLPAVHGLPPPPVGASADYDDDLPDSTPDVSTPAPRPVVAPAVTGAATTNGARQESAGITMKFGKAKGVPLDKMEEKDLRWYADFIEKKLDAPDEQKFRANNEKQLSALRAELASRSGGASAGAAATNAGDDFGNTTSEDDIPF